MAERHVFCTEGHYLGLFNLPETGAIPDDVVRQLALAAIRIPCEEDWFFLVTVDVLQHLRSKPCESSSELRWVPDWETWGIAKFCLAARKKVVLPEPASCRKMQWPYPNHELAQAKSRGDLVMYFRWDDSRPLRARAVVTCVHMGGGYSLRLEGPVCEGELPKNLVVYARRHEVFDLSFMS